MQSSNALRVTVGTDDWITVATSDTPLMEPLSLEEYMPDRSKVSVIEKYHGRNFPGYQVEEEDDVGKSGQYLRIIKGTELRHRVLVVRGFLQDHTPEEILTLLSEWRAPEQIRMAGTVLVLIPNRGER